LRWQRGALENLRAYGVTRQTLPYIGRQLLTYLGVAFVPFYLTALVYTLLTVGSISVPLFWLGVTAFIIFERTLSVKRGGWRAVGISALVLPEFAYDYFLHSVYLKAAIDTATGARETWAYTGPVDNSGSRWWRRAWDRTAGFVYGGIAILAVVGLAFAFLAMGIAWLVIAFLVLAFTAHAALRLSGLDPFGFALGDGETASLDTSSTSTPQGFGGQDVPAHAPSSAHRGDWR
jgi:biofilm PGA synthesis N-glycosyltransferase PgaC